MALQKRVSELPAVSQVAGTDLLIVSSNNATKRTTVQQIGAYFAANGVAGPQGPQGPSGANNWSEIAGKPSTFPPSTHTHAIADVTGLSAALDGKQAVGSYATLVGGKVPEAQLPSYVDDVIEAANLAALPATGETGKIYVTLDTNKTYRWSGSAYVEISASPGSTDAVPEGSVNLYYTNTRASAAAPVQSVAGRTGAVTLGVADVANAVSTSDSRLTDSREWSAATVSQADAEAGTSTSRFAYTPLRVFQAIAAWWAGSSAKTKLDGIAANATANATDAQLRDRATHTGTQAISTIVDLQAALDGKAATTHSHAIADVTGLQTALDGKQASGSYAAASHGHAIADVTGLQTALDGKASLSHTHSASAITDFSSAAAAAAPVQSVNGQTGAVTIATYSLPNATASTLGGVIVGTGLGVSSGTVSVTYGTASGTACQGNDARLSDTRTPTDGSVTDAKITSGGLSTSVLNWAAIQPWAANTAYSKGDLVSNAGIAYRRSAAGTSGATFNIANWQQITPSEFVGSQITSGTIATARLGSGSPSSANYLRGDGAWTAAPVTSVDGATGAVTITKAVVYEFTLSSAPAGVTGSNGSYSGFAIPSGAKLVEMLIIGAGGGGGSGRRGAASSARFGGGGGAGGGVIHSTLNPAVISTTLSVTVGAGGGGGAAVTADDTNGNAGSSGGVTQVTFGGGSADMLRAYGGSGGAGGTNAAGSGGGAGGTSNNRTWLGVGGSNSSITGTPNRAFPAGNVPQGGSAGGGIDASNNARAGAAQFAYMPFILETAQLGSDVSGGAASTTAAATAGANGVSFGYGGNGGGASANGNNSGAGGNGGNGYVRITVWS